MKEYFQLQYKMTNRKVAEFGLHPIITYLLFAAGFIGFSLYVFASTEFAVYLYLLLAFAATVRLSEIKRIEFLKTIFPKSDYFKVRLIENLIVVVPFLLFLAYKFEFSALFITLGLSVLMAFNTIKRTIRFTIPTPFHKKPYEYTVGFRNTFYLIFFAYFITYKAISVDNFNLGIFSLLLVFLLTLSYYSKPEDEFFVWSHNASPTQFLIEKIKIAILFSSVLTIPVTIILSIFFLEHVYVVIGFQLVGYLALITIIGAKYAAYPFQMSLPQGVLILLSCYLPLILIVVIPLFYQQATKHLKEYLE